jgi:hypothetical protein
LTELGELGSSERHHEAPIDWGERHVVEVESTHAVEGMPSFVGAALLGAFGCAQHAGKAPQHSNEVFRARDERKVAVR